MFECWRCKCNYLSKNNLEKSPLCFHARQRICHPHVQKPMCVRNVRMCVSIPFLFLTAAFTSPNGLTIIPTVNRLCSGEVKLCSGFAQRSFVSFLLIVLGAKRLSRSHGLPTNNFTWLKLLLDTALDGWRHETKSV